jgi:NAD(P)-dependent dehydrogenase (short-subunit alcohol dehydrogenase family)
MGSKVAIVTGANGGIGRELTKSLALAGYEVVMACRDLQKGIPVWEQLVFETKKEIQILPLDLSSIDSIQSFVTIIKKRYRSVDLLINNAGVIPTHSKTTNYNTEYCVGVNYVGPYMLTHLIIPHMNIGARIVNVVSMVYKYGKITERMFEPIPEKNYHKFKVYSQSKLALLYFTLDMADYCSSKGITINCCEPGIVNTPILKMGNKIVDFLAPLLFTPFVRSPKKGASTILHVALDETITQSGALYSNQKKREISPKFIQSSDKLYVRKITQQLIASLPIEL